MKAFDLEAAMLGDPIINRQGRQAKFIAYVPEASSVYCVVVVVSNEIFHVTRNGLNADRESPMDIFMAPKKRIVWVNFYENHQCVYFNLQSEANTMSQGVKRLGGKAYPVEIEE